MYNLRYVLFLLFILSTSISFGQDTGNQPDSSNIQRIEPRTPIPSDSIILQTDSTITSNDSTVVNTDSVAVGDLRTMINYISVDSMRMDVMTQTVHLYSKAKITYGDIELTGHYISIDFINESLKARPFIDSTGKLIDRPVFKQGGTEYTTDSMEYNFRTEKAIIYNVISQQSGGYLLGNKVKKNQYDELFVSEGKFCPCETPVAGTYIKSNKIKVVPKKKILTGPAQLYIGDVPTPLFIPFSMFPAPKEKVSGIRFPQYGEERRRGFFLRNGGYYWAINDYMDLDVLGSIYSKGGMGLNLTSNYRKRYRYSGGMNFSYEKVVSGNEEDSTVQKVFWLRWNHTPQSKGTGRFSASVNLGSTSYNQNVVQSVERNTSAQFNSNVTYSKTFTGTPINMALSARHNQNVNTGVVNATLPDFSLNVSRINPFKRKGSSGNKWYEKINFSYRFNSTVQLSNAAVRSSSRFDLANENPLNDSIIGFNFENADLLLDRAKIGGKHIIPISTSFKLFKHFTLSPSFNYEELWYPNKLDYTYVEGTNTVQLDTIKGFSRAYSYNGALSLNTNIYGTWNFKEKEGRRLQAMRHTIRPSISFSYSPNFGDTDRFDFYQNIQYNEEGDEQLISRYDGYVFGTPRLGESGSINLSVTNNLEAKMLAKNDSTGKAEKVSIIDNFGFSTSYNMVADSFNLSNINLTARTKLFKKKLDINTSGTLDPYTYELLAPVTFNSSGERVVRQRRVDQYAWKTGNGLGQISRARLAIGTSLEPKKKKNDRNNAVGPADQRDEDNLDNPDEALDPQNPDESIRAEDIGYLSGDPGLYVNFDVPWSLRINYTLSYTKVGFRDPEITQGVQFNGSLKLTPKWDIGFSSGYDIKRKEFTQTRLDITRDLNCWMMVLNWTPFGANTYYSFTIRIKSALLKDLKYNKQKSFLDR